jgi:integrase
MAIDKTHLRQRGNVWWLHYRIPERYQLLPACVEYNGIVTKSFKTDSLREARRMRDSFLRMLDAQMDDHYKAWSAERVEFTPSDTPQLWKPLEIPIKQQNPNVQAAISILSRGSSILGVNPKAEKLAYVANRELEAVTALFNERRHSGKSLKAIIKLVVKDKEAQGKAYKTINKIKRGSEWFLEQLQQTDIDIDQIDYDMVNDCVMDAVAQGLSGSTISGYLYGLNQAWVRAKRSKLVSGDNPFKEHSYRKVTISFDPFTPEEVQELYRNADTVFKTLIHAGATTGARISELLRAEVKVFSGYPCWAFNFKQKGKTPQSTRVVPMHDSLKLDDGFSFNLTYTSVRREMQSLIDEVLGVRYNELTGKTRRLTFHSFRSTVITELVGEQDLNEKKVGSVTGHKGGGTSQAGSIRGYLHVEDLRRKKKIVDSIPWSFG